MPPVAVVKPSHQIRGCASVIHPFGEEKQFKLGNHLATWVDPRPGSIVFGSYASMPKKGQPDEIYLIFCHSQESRTRILEERVCERGRVKVRTTLLEMNTAAEKLESSLSPVTISIFNLSVSSIYSLDQVSNRTWVYTRKQCTHAEAISVTV